MQSYDPYHRLGLALPEGTAPFEPRLVTATLTAVSPDAALASFLGTDGKPMEGTLPISEAVRGARWAVGEKHLLLQQDGSRKPLLSAVAPGIVEAILEGISPEVRDGRVQVMGVARAIGQRCKIAVASTVGGLDPVAACVGRHANRVKRLRAALNGEQVEIVAWHPQREVFLANALQPASVSDVHIDAETQTASAKAEPHQIQAAIGQNGQNARLAARLVKVHTVHIH